MKNNELQIVVSASQEVTDASEIEQRLGVPVEISTGRGLTGEPATLIVIAKVVATALGAIFPYVRDAILSRKVKTIKIGNITIENPTSEQVELVNQILRAMAGKDD